MSTASLGTTSTCVSRKAACCGPGRCRAACRRPARGNRLAVEVDDHDLDHLTYEDADKDIADIGWWEEHDRTDRRILLTLHGRESSVRYALIRTDSDWLMHLTKDQSAS